ncbi:MAG: YibE/F family protein, partial [Patescibacteria group bacterium]
RRGYLYLLAIVFSVVIVLIGKKQGFKSLISLILTFVVIMKYIVPKIVAGGNPLFVSIIGSVIILAVIIYLTWGFKLKAHIGLLSILLSLIITGLISILFTKLTELSGLSDENAMFLVGLSKTAINFKGLLLAGIVLGTVGVLDDVVISQISSVEQLSDANKSWKFKELYKSAMKVGVDHISSMTNTLFLAYAGASLPLLLLFNLNSGPFVNFSQIINNEAIATEIVRTLTGSVGLMLAMPLSTLIAAKYYARKYKNIKT